MGKLLREAAAQGIAPQYVSKLLSALRAKSSQVSAEPGEVPHTPTLIEPPTKREMEVLASVAEGKSNREIAGVLFITEKTVKTHVSNILKKLHLGNRTELKWWYQRQCIAGQGGLDDC